MYIVQMISVIYSIYFKEDKKTVFSFVSIKFVSNSKDIGRAPVETITIKEYYNL